jgi:ADP-heptose:LPS heptosyltransferase/tetratricopeptide (TPR) repeat protein
MSTLLVSARLMRFARYVIPAGSPGKIAERLFRRASAARSAGHYLAAGILYEEALRFTPGLGRVHVQAGHMFKEAGDFEQAEVHYRRAYELMPDNPDLALQFGHFYKLSGRPDEAMEAYRRALALAPGWPDAADELATLEQSGNNRKTQATERENSVDFDDDREWLVSELLPRAAAPADRTYRNTLHVHQIGGRRKRTRWGMMAMLSGVEAVRGYCISPTPVNDLQILIDEVVLYSGPVHGFDLAGSNGQRKYVFNLWLDFSAFAPGRYEIEIRCTNAKRQVHTHRQNVAVQTPSPEGAYRDSDGFVTIDPSDPRPIVDQVNARPSMVRKATRALLDTPRPSILIQRVDQLGDLVASVPAIRHLRALLPGATLVAMLSPANVELGRTLELFDAIVVADCPEDALSGRRFMPLAAQKALRNALAPYRFDLAIDLCENGWSRPLMRLSGAPVLYGFRTAEAAWLSADVTGASHDPINGHENASHSAKIVALVAWLGAIIQRHDVPIPLVEDSRNRLGSYGICQGRRYVVLHCGARLAFSRWPGFGVLAGMLLEQTDLHVIAMTETSDTADDFAPEHAGSSRLHLMSGKMPFEDFDALLANAAVFVGNDSGPKHLAALRGTPTVSIHMARLNWNEWGQSEGMIVSRRVPCAGCGIHNAPEECGQNFACITHIRPDEVLDAVMRLLA